MMMYGAAGASQNASQSQNAGDVELSVLFQEGAYLVPEMQAAIEAQMHAFLSDLSESLAREYPPEQALCAFEGRMRMKLVSVVRIVNKTRAAIFEVLKASERFKGHRPKQFLHGTHPKNFESIANNGIAYNYKPDAAMVYGMGNYFGERFAQAIAYGCQVFVVEAHVGETAIGTPHLPEDKFPIGASGRRVSTTTDALGKIWCIPDSNCINAQLAFTFRAAAGTMTAAELAVQPRLNNEITTAWHKAVFGADWTPPAAPVPFGGGGAMNFGGGNGAAAGAAMQAQAAQAHSLRAAYVAGLQRLAPAAPANPANPAPAARPLAPAAPTNPAAAAAAQAAAHDAALTAAAKAAHAEKKKKTEVVDSLTTGGRRLSVGDRVVVRASTMGLLCGGRRCAEQPGAVTKCLLFGSQASVSVALDDADVTQLVVAYNRMAHPLGRSHTDSYGRGTFVPGENEVVVLCINAATEPLSPLALLARAAASAAPAGKRPADAEAGAGACAKRACL
jgi:hypothetical protein